LSTRSPELQEWQSRLLDAVYPVTFIDEFIAFLAFPPEVRRVICTTDEIVGFRRQIADRPFFRGAIAAMSDAEPMPALRGPARRGRGADCGLALHPPDAQERSPIA